MSKDVIIRNFCRNAAKYEEHAGVQKKCGRELIDFIGKEDFACILEIGCGTGIYTRILRERYKNADITAIDASKDMIEIACRRGFDEKVRFMVMDGEGMAFKEEFDLITSNASFQWFSDLFKTFGKMKSLLKDKGVLCFSIYGPETFRELKSVVRLYLGERQDLTSSKFVCFKDLEDMLKQYFKKIEIKEKRFIASFPCLWDFLHDIKKSGARGQGLAKNIYLGRNAIKDMEKIYIKKFGNITATHEVYFCKAYK